MTLEEFLRKVEEQDPALAAKLRVQYNPDGNTDLAALNVTARYKLEKFEGEYSPEKEPYEVIEGGDDIPTTVTRR